MDLSFARQSFRRDAVPVQDAAALLTAWASYRQAVDAADRGLFAPATGAFNGAIATLLADGIAVSDQSLMPWQVR